MAQTLGPVSTIVAAGGVAPVGSVAGTVRCFQETITYASQADGDTIVLGYLPKGARLLYGILNATASSGSATIAIGVSGTPAKYKAAAAFTATDTPTLFGKAAATQTQLAADETIIATIAAAALPSSGTLQVTLVYTTN